MEGDIELDDIQVVEVTGKDHKDKTTRGRHGSGCSPSLRVKTILIFVVIGAIYVLGVIVGNVLMRISLEALDEGSCNTSINRLSLLIFDDMVKLKQLTRTYSISTAAVDFVKDPFNATVVYTFVTSSLMNMSYVYDENGNMMYDPVTSMPVVQYSPGCEINYWAILDTELNTIRSVYYPQDPKDTSIMTGFVQVNPQPEFSPDFYKRVIEQSENPRLGWLKLHIPEGGPDDVREPYIVSFEPIMMPGDKNETADDHIYGYLVASRQLKPRMKLFSDSVPSCISMMRLKSDESAFDNIDLEMFDDVVAGSLSGDKTYAGKPVFLKRAKKDIKKVGLRICPAVALFNETDNLMTGYMKLCGDDPKAMNEEDASCVSIRLDRPMSMVDQGTEPVILLSVEIIVMMIFLCVIFVIFLDCVVLRRIVNLSNVIKKQTRTHESALKDSTGEGIAAAEDGNKYQSHGGKKGKSAGGSADHSRTGSSSEAGAAPVGQNARDEIGNLKRIMEQNALGLRKRLEAVNDSIKVEQQKTIRHKQAMQLLNLWCGRKDYFPGLRPNAMQLRYEPTRSLDDLLANPLAIEYLKSHCDSDRTLENLWFLLDVSWLGELETAEDKEEDAQKRKQIHQVATASARTILARYIAVNAPQQINISAASFKALRGKGDVYERGMFDTAVSEVKLMLNTDILPRFQKSAAYSAMSETLFIDSSGGGDESEFSDETVSTAGSILTDEGEEAEGGVARVFAHTFKNLHNTFDVGHDNDASSTYSADSSRASNTMTSGVAPSNSVVLGTQTTTTNTGVPADDKDDSSLSESEDSEEKPAPKKKEEEKKEEQPKKATVRSADSSDSSDSSSSTDSSSSSSITVSSSSD